MLLLGAVLWSGCQDAGQAFDPFNVLGQAQAPVRVGVTTLDLSPLLVPKYDLFRMAYAQYLRQPVQFCLMSPRQIRVHLNSGRLSLALLQPEDYAELGACDDCEILAVPVNENGRTYRQGLIIVSADSPIQSLTDLKDRRFHFMPRGNLLNIVALGALTEAGVAESDVDRGVLGLGLDTYHISSLEVARSVAFESRSAGVIAEANYESWPDAGGNLMLLKPAKDQVRVLARTVRIPQGPVLVSNHVSEDLRKATERFLFEICPAKHKLALSALGCQRFDPPVPPAEYEPFARIYRAQHPSEPMTQPAATQPDL